VKVSRLCGALVAAALTVAGCGTQQSTPSGGPAVAATGAALVARPVSGGTAEWTSCRQELGSAWPVGSTTDSLTLAPLARAFDPKSVVECSERVETRADGGQELVATEQQGTETAALTAALRLPDAPATSGSCGLVLYTVPWFAVLDSHRRWVRPGVPADACRDPRGEVLEALRGLKLRTVSTVAVRLVESGAAVRSGCGEGWSDMVEVETSAGGDGTVVATRADPFAGVSQLRVCLFAVPTGQLGGIKPAGTFTRGGMVSGASRRKLGSLLATLPAAAPCAKEATRFAVLTRTNIGQDPTVYVELDGCHRVLVQTSVRSGPYSKEISTLSQASAALVADIDRFHPTP
jgi:hypothetical protein